MIAIAVHGGAGVMPGKDLTAARQQAFHDGLAAALRAGFAVMESGGLSLDAVVAAVKVLEDDPLFNAGRGSVVAANGLHELDASIMDGRDLRAGSVSGVSHVRNPVELARLVMDRSPHVMLAGAGADEFAVQQGLEPVPNEYFATERRRLELDRHLRGEADVADEAVLGTVGAVALDAHGNLAAATSTGGMTAKKWGRVGDSPIIGAGTYADNASCAVSGTGHGEYFIRAVVAHDICALVAYRGWSLQRAAREVVQEKLKARGGEGGVIAIDPAGQVVMEFNSDGMFRAMRDSRGQRSIAILRERPDYGAR